MTKLPALLGQIATIAGEPAAVKIAARAGGTRVYIPKHAADDHWLVETVGRERADAVCRELGGARYDVPLGVSGSYQGQRRERARQVHALDKAGKSSREIARAVGLTQRAVHAQRAVHRGRRKDDKQGSLF